MAIDDDDDIMVYAPDQEDVEKTVYGYIAKYSEEHGGADPTNRAGSGAKGKGLSGKFESMFNDVFQAGGIAAVEAARQALNDISTTENERLSIAKSYTNELREQTTQMAMQNQQLASSITKKEIYRQSDETLQSTLDRNQMKRVQDASHVTGMEPIPVVIKEQPNTSKNTPSILSVPQQAQGPGNSPSSRVNAPTGRVNATGGRIRPTNVSSNLDTYKEVLGKLGMNNVLRSVNQFDGVIDRIRRGSEGLQKLGDTINPSKASVNLATSGSRIPSGDEVAANQTEEARQAVSGSNTTMSESAVSKGGVGAVTQKMADTAEKAGSIASTATEGGFAARAASTIGGGLSKAAGLLGRVASNPIVAGGTAVLGAVKAGRDEMFNARRMGSLQGGGGGEGLAMQGEDRIQDAKNFLGISNVSGDELDRYRTNASRQGFDINSDAGRNYVDIQSYAKEQGIDPNVAGDFTRNIVAFGGSADDAKQALDDLKESAKNTGVDLESLAKSTAKASDAVDRYQGGNSEENRKRTAETTTGLMDAFRSSNPNITPDQAQGIVSNPMFTMMAMQAAPEKDKWNFIAPELASSYLNDNPEVSKQAANNIKGFDKGIQQYIYNSAKSSTRYHYTDKEARNISDRMTAYLNHQMGLDALSSNATAFGNDLRNNDYKVNIHVTASDDLNVKVRQSNAREQAFSGTAPYTAINNDRP